jgi:signal transduction histidine kinase
MALCIYRVLQESLRNAAKHAKPEHIEVILTGADGTILVEITDDGAGFVPEEARQTPGIGLASMRERVDYVNGRLNIWSEPGRGTVIEVAVPAQRRN